MIHGDTLEVILWTACLVFPIGEEIKVGVNSEC